LSGHGEGVAALRSSVPVADFAVTSPCGCVRRFDVTKDAERGGAVITRARHRGHIGACLQALESFLARPAQVDMAAEELRVAAHSLGAVTGVVDVEEVLDVLFRDFCIGK
jgi:tRNA U34 5-carboxymethylaminomethyl modifying GTPase MnmE/TrmE